MVDHLVREYKLNDNSWILDPFVGCGTSSVEAKRLGINSIGIKLHPFVYHVAVVKTFWEFDLKELRKTCNKILETIGTKVEGSGRERIDIDDFPDLLYKCYSLGNLAVLKLIRNHIVSSVENKDVRDFLNLGLTNTLRTASRAGAGWPYIAPTKYHEKNERDAFPVFYRQFTRCYRTWNALRKPNRKIL